MPERDEKGQGQDSLKQASSGWFARPSFKKSLNASKPSNLPPDRGKMSKRLGGIVGCKDKTFSWHLIGFPDGSNVGSTV